VNAQSTYVVVEPGGVSEKSLASYAIRGSGRAEPSNHSQELTRWPGWGPTSQFAWYPGLWLAVGTAQESRLCRSWSHGSLALPYSGPSQSHIRALPRPHGVPKDIRPTEQGSFSGEVIAPGTVMTSTHRLVPSSLLFRKLLSAVTSRRDAKSCRSCDSFTRAEWGPSAMKK
jgi:hypothetical protein